MSVIIQTEVFTLSELVDRGDDRAVDRALEWVDTAFAVVFSDMVTEYLSDALRAAKLDHVSIDEWDYYRQYVTIQGEVSSDDLSAVPPGHFLGGVRETDADEIVRAVEGRLARRMVEFFDSLTGRDELLDLAEANEYTFTVDGMRFG